MFETTTRAAVARSLADVLATRSVEIFTLVLQSHGFTYADPTDGIGYPSTEVEG